MGKRPRNRRGNSDPTLLVKTALKGVKKAAQSATSVVGAVASEMAGEEVLKPNSPGSMVTTALASAKKAKYLGRRIFYSFCPSYRTSLVLEDISRCFTDREMAERAFQIFDRDGNGDATLEEVEMALLECHRERLALGRSMRDIDSAVSRCVVSDSAALGCAHADHCYFITQARQYYNDSVVDRQCLDPGRSPQRQLPNYDCQVSAALRCANVALY